MKRYRVRKPRFVYGRVYREGDELEAAPNSLLRRAVRDGDLDLIGDAPARPAEPTPAPAATTVKRKPKAPKGGDDA